MSLEEIKEVFWDLQVRKKSLYRNVSGQKDKRKYT